MPSTPTPQGSSFGPVPLPWSPAWIRLATQIATDNAAAYAALVQRASEYVRTPGFPWQLPGDLQRWGQVRQARRKPQWVTPHRVVLETPRIRLRDFTAGDDDVIPTVILPPQAGHDSSIVDYSESQSQVSTMQAAGLTRLFSVDYVGATQATKNTTVEDYMADLERVVSLAGDGGQVNLVGDCQGGWLACIYAALHPDEIHTLTLAGSPIDFGAEALIADYVEVIAATSGMAFYRAMVASGNGVLPGRYLKDGFIAMKPQAEVDKQMQLLSHLDDEKHLERYQAFEDWFDWTQDVPGTFYLWLVEHLFKNNELIHGDLVVGGRTVDMRQITCPLYLLAGQTDHITPPAQVFNAAEHVGTPADDVLTHLAPGGHLGLFMGREALREHWPVLLSDIATRSRSGGSASARLRAAKGTTPPVTLGTPPIEAP